MPTIVVTSAEPGAGKTGVAVAIARHFAYLGTPTRLFRIADESSAAAADAAYFGSLTFVPGSPAAPLVTTEPASADIVDVVEANAEAAATLAASGAKVVLVSRHQAGKPGAGLSPVASIVTAVQTMPPGGSGTTIMLTEDRTLAGFSISEVQAALSADTLVEGDKGDATCDYLVIAPISSDAGQPYFRRFPAAAVVVRFDKTDMHLAAMQAEPECLVLTGGRRPSDYLFDAAGAKGIPVLLSRTDTENTVIALEGIFDRTRFQGERKLDRMSELLEATSLYSLLA